MANPTTNFGWQMPTATDLVTDLPADFEVFGQAVDTDFVGLLGGTTGQVLAKASGTDLDFVWSADAAGMTNPMTTTADIIYSSSGSTPARLGIGTALQVLAVNSGATAPEWTTISSGSYTLISTATPSAVSTFEFTSIPGTYKKLYLVGDLVPSADGNGQNYLEFNSDTGSLYRKYNYGSAGAASVSLEASNQMQVHNNMDNVKGFSIAQEYHNYTATNMKIMTQYVVGWQYDAPTTAVTTYQNTNYIYGGTSAISNIKFYAVTGTYTGTVSLYGQN
jgi:hypothetical protein